MELVRRAETALQRTDPDATFKTPLGEKIMNNVILGVMAVAGLILLGVVVLILYSIFLA